MAALIDLHVHTNRYSPCSLLDPWTLPGLGAERGISGLALTEHGCLWPVSEWTLLKDGAADLDIFRAIELCFSECEVLVYGASDRILQGLPEGLGPALEAIDQARGASVLAHPFRYSVDMEQIRALLLENPFHGIEVVNGSLSEASNRMAEALAIELGLAQTAGSDAHARSKVGWCATCFDDEILDDDALAAAIRSRRCRGLRAW